MHLELFQYIEGDDAANVGEYKGYIALEEDDIRMELNDDELAEEMEQLFSEPIVNANGLLTDEKEAEPYTLEFFRCVLPILPDYGVRGVLKGDEEGDQDDYIRMRANENGESVEEVKEEDNEPGEMGIEMISIEDLDESEPEVDEDY